MANLFFYSVQFSILIFVVQVGNFIMLRANFLLGRTPIPNMDMINANCVVEVLIEIIKKTVIRT